MSSLLAVISYGSAVHRQHQHCLWLAGPLFVVDHMQNGEIKINGGWLPKPAGTPISRPYKPCGYLGSCLGLITSILLAPYPQIMQLVVSCEI